MGRTKSRFNEIFLDQSNFSAGDPISLGNRIIGVTIRCAFDSANNVQIGWNSPASSGNTIIPGQSVSYGFHDANFIDGNKLYVGFDVSGAGGKAVITIETDEGGEEIC